MQAVYQTVFVSMLLELPYLGFPSGTIGIVYSKEQCCFKNSWRPSHGQSRQNNSLHPSTSYQLGILECILAFPLVSWQKPIVVFFVWLVFNVVTSVFAFDPCPEGRASLWFAFCHLVILLPPFFLFSYHCSHCFRTSPSKSLIIFYIGAENPFGNGHIFPECRPSKICHLVTLNPVPSTICIRFL